MKESARPTFCATFSKRSAGGRADSGASWQGQRCEVSRSEHIQFFRVDFRQARTTFFVQTSAKMLATPIFSMHVSTYRAKLIIKPTAGCQTDASTFFRAQDRADGAVTGCGRNKARQRGAGEGAVDGPLHFGGLAAISWLAGSLAGAPSGGYQGDGVARGLCQARGCTQGAGAKLQVVFSLG